MDILFVQSGHRRVATVVTRQDKVRLSVPVFGPLDPLPHDLAHYVIEQELGLHDGFWGSVAAGALFGGMKILAGRQRPHAAERSREVLTRHRQGIGVSEILVDAGLRVVTGLSRMMLPCLLIPPWRAHGPTWVGWSRKCILLWIACVPAGGPLHQVEPCMLRGLIEILVLPSTLVGVLSIKLPT